MTKKDYAIIIQILAKKHKELSGWSMDDKTPPPCISLAYIEDFINELKKNYDNFNTDLFVDGINEIVNTILSPVEAEKQGKILY
jgi:hypothetical protein